MTSPQPVTGDERQAPWPIIMECRWPAPTLVKQGHRCAQCAGTHDHIWVEWRDPDWEQLMISGPGLPVRCEICGGRKCDVETCFLRRHHREPHEPPLEDA